MHGFGRHAQMHPHHVPNQRFGPGFGGIGPVTAGLIGAGIGYLGGELFDHDAGYGGYGPGFGGYGPGFGPGFGGYGPGFGGYGPDYGYGNPGFNNVPGYGYQGYQPGFGHYGNVGYNQKFY